MLLTVAWGGSLIAGRCDLDDKASHCPPWTTTVPTTPERALVLPKSSEDHVQTLQRKVQEELCPNSSLLTLASSAQSAVRRYGRDKHQPCCAGASNKQETDSQMEPVQDGSDNRQLHAQRFSHHDCISPSVCHHPGLHILPSSQCSISLRRIAGSASMSWAKTSRRQRNVSE